MGLIPLLFVSFTLAADESTHEVAVHGAVERSLPYLQREGEAWIEDRKCVSCHQASFMLWSCGAAALRGMPVDRDKLEGSFDWSFQFAVENRVASTNQRDGGGLDTMAQLLLARRYGADSPERSAQVVDLVDLIVAAQQADGSWQPAGQLPMQKRPPVETTQVTTMWTALALDSLDEAPPQVVESRRKAVDWLAGRKADGKSTEWWAAGLLVEDRFGSPQSAAEVRKELLARQNSDGGWAWLQGDESDAFATGQSLYALGATGADDDQQAILRAQRFLVETQQKDGAWAVKGTKKNKQQTITETASYWGTAWAVLGLLETTPE